MTIANISDLKIDTLVSYKFFNNLKFKGTDAENRHVLLEDANNETKKVYIELFLKHAKIL